MVVEHASFQLIFPDTLIKALSQLVGEAKFDVNAVYLEDPDVPVAIQGGYKDGQLHFLFQDDFLHSKLADSIRCQITSGDPLLQSREISFEHVNDTSTGSLNRKPGRRGCLKRAVSKQQKKSLTNADSASCIGDQMTDSHVTQNEEDKQCEETENHCQNCDSAKSSDMHNQVAISSVCDGQDSREQCSSSKALGDVDSTGDHLMNCDGQPLTSLSTDKLSSTNAVQCKQTVAENILQCSLCQEVLNSVNELQTHLMEKHQLLLDDYCKSNSVSLTKLNNVDSLVKMETARVLSRRQNLSQSNTRSTRLQSKRKSLAFASTHCCSYCEMVFGHRKSLNVHIRDVHGKFSISKIDKEKVEEIDKLGDVNKAELFKEISQRSAEIAVKNDVLSTEDNGTVCLICEKVFMGTRWSVRSRLGRHIQTQHEISLGKYKELLDADSAHNRMRLAQEIIATQWNRKKEKKKQLLGEKSQFHCAGCGRQYCAFNNLMKHIRVTHKEEDDFKQILLSAEEQGSAVYRPDMRAREQLEMTCVYCGVKRIGTCILKHLKNVHSDEKTFKEELKKATEEHAKIINEREKERKKKGPQISHNDRLFECQYCRKQFKHRQARYRHSRFKCPENTEKCKKLWCRCGKGFLAKESLAKHKLKCDKREKKYMCHLCGKMYGTPSGLYIHKQTTHCDTVGGKYKHACEVCGKMFYRKQHYDRHIPKHSDERSCQCEICGKRFKTKEDIRKHQYAVHFHKYTYYCKDCGHGMNKLSYLKSHKCGRVRRQQEGVSLLTAKKQEKPVKPEKAGNIVVKEQQLLFEETGEVSTDQVGVMPLSNSDGTVIQEGISQMFQCSTAVANDRASILPNTLAMHQNSPTTLQMISSTAYGNSSIIQGIVSGEQEMELTIQNMVVREVTDVQGEPTQNVDAANLLEMATYDTNQMLLAGSDYPLLQGTTASVMVQQPSSAPLEPVSLTSLSPAVSQATSTSYAVPQTYQIVHNSYQ